MCFLDKLIEKKNNTENENVRPKRTRKQSAEQQARKKSSAISEDDYDDANYLANVDLYDLNNIYKRSLMK